MVGYITAVHTKLNANSYMVTEFHLKKLYVNMITDPLSDVLNVVLSMNLFTSIN